MLETQPGVFPITLAYVCMRIILTIFLSLLQGIASRFSIISRVMAGGVKIVTYKSKVTVGIRSRQHYISQIIAYVRKSITVS